MKEKIEIILDAINKTRGENIKIYDNSSINPFIDYVIICEATSYRQVYALANNVKEALKENKYTIKSFEGKKDSKWILIDVDDVVVHVFLDDERMVYDLDELYQDYEVENLDDIQ